MLDAPRASFWLSTPMGEPVSTMHFTLGVPLMVGLSRKSMIGTLTGRDIEHRAAGSAAAALIAVQKGVLIVRVHDVAETRDALAIWQGVASGAPIGKKAQKPFGSQRFEDD